MAASMWWIAAGGTRSPAGGVGAAATASGEYGRRAAKRRSDHGTSVVSTGASNKVFTVGRSGAPYYHPAVIVMDLKLAILGS